MRLLRLPSTLLVALLATTGLAAASPAKASPTPTYDVTVTRTENGTPHIKAADYASLGYGYAYAFAQDNICTMAQGYVTVDAQRSLFFGPGASYVQAGNGTVPNNLNSDTFWQAVIDDKRVEGFVAQPPPLGPKPQLKQLVTGYVAGWNRYLADIGGPKGVPDPTCKGQPWVRPISEATAYRRFYQLQLLASQTVVLDGIGGATPPSTTSPGVGSAPNLGVLTQQLGERFASIAIGSNAVAVGKAGTADKTHGLLLGNPHFPWLGTERFYQAQLTIPGVLDVAGASLYGVPLILIGHTRNMAWSHTVSTAFRFTPYQLTLAPGTPTSYLYDGAVVPMTTRTVTVRTGATSSVTRTLYGTRFGPVFTSLLGIPFPWTAGEAFAMRDANADGMGLLFNHFLDFNQAQTTQEALSILQRYQGIPWVNTIVSDRGGQALYADIGAVPHVTDDQARSCGTALGAATFASLGLPVLDGSRSACEWGSDADSPRKGLFGAANLPFLLREDYVTNSNDSYWLSNPKQPLPAFPRIIGDHATERSLRTRIGLIMTQGIVDSGGFTRQAMQDMVFNDRQYAAELTRDDLVSTCRQLPGGMAPTSSGPPVPVGKACDVLAAWDRKEDPSSRGALLFRRFWEHAVVSATVTSVPPFLMPFRASDPVNTPNTLNPVAPNVRTSLGDAIQDLGDAKLALDAPLSAAQFSTRNGARIPIPGGPAANGQFNAIDVSWDPARGGYPDPPDGSSYVQVVTWHDATGCPDAATILTYSLSANPASPFYADQTAMFAKKQWATERFCAADVAAHAVTVLHLTAKGATPPSGLPAQPAAARPSSAALAATGPLAGPTLLALLLLGFAGVLRHRTS